MSDRRTMPVAGALVALAAGASALLGAAPAAAAGTESSVACSVADATLTWGFKESFRSYISGSIARGEWQVADGATYTTPLFSWAAGTGALEGGVGAVAFAGGIRFTGHEGLLDTSVADPILRITSPTTAQLLLDVTGTTQEGAAIDLDDVVFADVDLSATPAPTDGPITVTDAPATLAADGAAAFGTYEAGTALDPISASVPVACAAPEPSPSAAPVEAADDADAAPPASAPEPASDASALPAVAIGGGALVAVAALVATLLVRRRRASCGPTSPDVRNAEEAP